MGTVPTRLAARALPSCQVCPQRGSRMGVEVPPPILILGVSLGGECGCLGLMSLTLGDPTDPCCWWLPLCTARASCGQV